MTVMEAVNVRITVAWQGAGDALVYAGDYRANLVGALRFENDQWLFVPTADEGESWANNTSYIEVDAAQEQAFRDQRSDILAQIPRGDSYREVALTELDGRVRMHRDETRWVAALGAKIEARRWWRELHAPAGQKGRCVWCGQSDVLAGASCPKGQTHALTYGASVPENRIAPHHGGRHDPLPDVKARRNYKAMTEDHLIEAYQDLIRGHGSARRKTLDWRADIPYVEEVMVEKFGLNPSNGFYW